ncbi:alpha/beta hydrolase [Sinomonas humi]|uniref:Alpha/beta hydrolase n=1 Tax=Sinomonas humi TaxID=1338436 RepID=A0A0B2ASG0_9MICC|nr:alpha/beta fold hydrolase [Sinomonas humi]KHL04930.1 alpha/beta hydrolase [Sinomonas humi]
MPFDPSSYEFTPTSGPIEVRPNTVLPARRENIELRTEDGLTLVGELALPAEAEPKATLVTLHPLPTHGGFMDSHVFRKASFRLPALADLAVVRFNTRGTSSPRGTSEGSFEEGIGERADVEAAVRFAADRGLPGLWLVGWSFGTELALKYGALPPVEPQIEGAVLLSPPLHRAGEDDLAMWASSGKPLTVIVPEHDDYLRPAEARERFAAVPQAKVIGVDGAKHLWVGEKFVQRVLGEIVSTVTGETAGAAAPLPTSWEGPVAVAAS